MPATSVKRVNRIREAQDKVTRNLILLVLEKHNWSKAPAAKELGICRDGLNYHLRRLRIVASRDEILRMQMKAAADQLHKVRTNQHGRPPASVPQTEPRVEQGA